VQKIGLAISDDLFKWRKHKGNPVIVADGRWYETVSESALTEAWRDPHLHYDEATGFFYAFVTAQANSGPPRYRGCIGAARSKDLLQWEVLPPVCSPNLYAQMETPQLLLRRGRYFLTFCTWFWDYSPDWGRKIGGPQTGLHAFVSDELTDRYRPIGDAVVLGTDSNLYGTRIVVGPKGEDLALSWCIRTEEEPEFAGRLSLPMKAEFTEDGLAIARG
jgi:beta-fructofuranosidase